MLLHRIAEHVKAQNWTAEPACILRIGNSTGLFHRPVW